MRHNTINILPIILANGEGTRLWPISTKSKPKPYINLFGADSFLQQTIKRISNLKCLPPSIIAGKRYRKFLKSQLIDLLISDLILFDKSYGTAAAICISAIMYKNFNFPLLFLPIDHWFSDDMQFLEDLQYSVPYLERDTIQVFAVKPEKISSEYGYIQKGKKLRTNTYYVKDFYEKPPYKIAQEFSKDPSFLWNTGIYAGYANSFIHIIEKCFPKVYEVCETTLKECLRRKNNVYISSEYMKLCPYHIVEEALFKEDILKQVYELKVQWVDIGSWDSLEDILLKDKNNNIFRGNIDGQESTGNFIFSQSSKKIILNHVHNLILIESEEGIFVSARSSNLSIKNILSKITT